MRLLFRIYIRVIRPITSPLLYWILKPFYWRLPDKWEKIKEYDEDNFARVLAEYDYLHDPIGGFLDFSPQQKDYFFNDLNFGRDCDGWSRLWYWWAKEKGLEVYEIAMLDKNSIDGFSISAHMVTVAKVNGEYRLYDYRPRGNAETIEKVLEKNAVNYEEFSWLVYKR